MTGLLFYSMPKGSDDVVEILEELPSGFIKDYDFGLGFLKEYRFIVDAVEELSSCTEIVISRSLSAKTEINKEDSKIFEYLRFHIMTLRVRESR